eukprot:m.312126 g.312126  ORF g.312126 m.312126 type:complete len:54 (-) comp16484_c0_seq8:184-345(-)
MTKQSIFKIWFHSTCDVTLEKAILCHNDFDMVSRIFLVFLHFGKQPGPPRVQP